jgi:hypothetical protein
MSTALRDTSVSLKTLIENTLSADPEVQALLPPGDTLKVSLNTPDEMEEAGEQGISLWLYRVVRDDNRLNAPPIRTAPDRLRPPPLPMRLHYLVTPLFERLHGLAAPEVEQTLLGKVLQLFYETPQLRDGMLLGVLAGHDLEITVRLETLSLDELARVWDSLDRSYRLSLAYEVAVVPIQSRRAIVSGPPVGTFLPEYGVAAEVAS